MQGTQTDVDTFLGELDGGVFREKIAVALSEVASGAINTNKVGNVSITLSMKRLSENSEQVVISHKLTFAKPTKKGKTTEEQTTETPMYVGRGGKMTLWPQEQEEMFVKEEDKPGPANVSKLRS